MHIFLLAPHCETQFLRRAKALFLNSTLSFSPFFSTELFLDPDMLSPVPAFLLSLADDGSDTDAHQEEDHRSHSSNIY